MRIRSRGGNGTNNAGSACTSFQSGETEDYLITIAQQFPCTAPPTAGAAISSAIKVCPDETFSLQLSGGTSGSGQSYQWQTSTDSVVWANVVGATNISYSTTQSQNTYYRCYVTCSTLSDTSTAIKITTKTAIECYCTSSATNTGDDDIGNVTFGNINNGIGTPATNNATSTHLYTDFTTLTPDTFTETLTYPISITQINFGNNTFACWISVYIDYNHDGTFDVPGDLAFVSRSAQGAGGNVVSGNITFPPNSAGQTRMRIVMNEQGSATQTACGPYQWGETEDYTIVIKAQAPCVGPPDAGIILASSSAVCPNQTINFSLQGATQGSGMTYQWQSSADSLVWLDIAAATNYIYSTTQSQTTYYRCVLTCSGMGDTSTAVKVNQKSANQCYCDSYALNANDSDIGNVTFGGINNGTSTPVTNNPAANKTYTDFTSLTPSTFVESVNYPITVNQINSNNFFAAQVSVFIDYSKDGIFQTSELAFTARSAASALGNLVSGTITIPVGVAGTTRMRVVLNEQGNAGQTACGTYPYGETEDYLITVVAQTPCVSPPSAGNALANFTSVCSTNTITFNLSGGAAGTGMSYQWQSSTDSINYNDIAGATNYFYSSTQNGSTYYRCVLACSGLSDTSTSVLVTQKAVVDCYCTSNANNTADADIGNVTFGNLNNGLATPALNNPASNHTYTNFTTLAPETFIENASYTLSVTQINSANFFPSWVRVFIDYNMDGDFDDAGEAVLVAQTNNTAGGNTITGTVTIPSGVQGNTRMRVVMNSTGSATLSACGTYAWGETEDYTIHLELFVGIKTINNTVNGFVIAPNPANGSTKISYMLADKNNVSLDVYNLVGEKITSLVNETQNVGKRTIDFDTKSMGMKAGVYLLKIKTGSSAQTLRLVVMD